VAEHTQADDIFIYGINPDFMVKVIGKELLFSTSNQKKGEKLKTSTEKITNPPSQQDYQNPLPMRRRPIKIDLH